MKRLKELQELNNRSEYDFKDLIEAYSKSTVEVLTKTDSYQDWENGGVWVDGKEEWSALDLGAVVPLSTDDWQRDEGGTFNQNTRKLYCYEKIEKGSKVKSHDLIYSILRSEDYSDYDIGLYMYYIGRGERDD